MPSLEVLATGILPVAQEAAKHLSSISDSPSEASVRIYFFEAMLS
jgi:hypothetical protein